MSAAAESAARDRSARRAQEAWGLLVSTASRRDRRGWLVVLDRPGGAAATLWPYSQVLHAAVVVGALREDPTPARLLGRGLERYRHGPAYASRRLPGRGARFFDDNAWVGLAAAHAALLGAEPEVLRLARRLLGWLRAGEAPGGGVRWREGQPGLHACSTGTTGLLAARAQPGGRAPTGADLALAVRCREYMAGPLRTQAGLVADNITRGVVDATVCSYNQGLAIGLDVVLHRAGVPGSLDRARNLTDRAWAHFDAADRLWREPVCFASVLLRMLLLLDSADPDPRWPAAVDGYLDRVWAQARTADGRFSGGGIGAYERESTLDLAGLVILCAVRALGPGRAGLIC